MGKRQKGVVAFASQVPVWWSQEPGRDGANAVLALPCHPHHRGALGFGEGVLALHSWGSPAHRISDAEAIACIDFWLI